MRKCSPFIQFSNTKDGALIHAIKWVDLENLTLRERR